MQPTPKPEKTAEQLLIEHRAALMGLARGAREKGFTETAKEFEKRALELGKNDGRTV